jgi:hypothetical protein
MIPLIENLFVPRAILARFSTVLSIAGHVGLLVSEVGDEGSVKCCCYGYDDDDDDDVKYFDYTIREVRFCAARIEALTTMQVNAANLSTCVMQGIFVIQ